MENLDEIIHNCFILEENFAQAYKMGKTIKNYSLFNIYGQALFIIIDELLILEKRQKIYYNKFFCPYNDIKVNDNEELKSLDRLHRMIKNHLEMHKQIVNMIKEKNFQIDEYYDDNITNVVFNTLHSIRKLDKQIKQRNEKKKVCPYINSKHAISEKDYIDFMLSPNNSSGKKTLKDFVMDAKELIIIDPYIYKEEENDFFKKSNPSLKSLTDIKIIYDPSNAPNTNLEKSIINSVNNKCKVVSKESYKFHDRVWIVDKTRGLVVGTSLNGIGGKKVSFMLDLPKEDLNNLIVYLKREGLIF